MSISVIIPSYHSQSTIEECLQSLINQSTEEDYEILVINSSDDETPEIVKDKFPSVRLIQLERRVSAARARNTGIREAGGNIMAFIDADCSAAFDWLRKIAAWHGKGYRAVAGSIVNKSIENIYSRAEYPLEILEFSPNNPKREVKFASAANSSFTRDIFEKYGFFPEIRAGEDLVFSQKMAEKGERIIFDPQIRVFHKNEINLKDYLKKQILHGFYSYKVRRMARVHGSSLSNPIILPLLLPFLPLIRALRVIYRSICLKNNLSYDIAATFPLFFLGCIMWSSGCTKGFIEHFKKIY